MSASNNTYELLILDYGGTYSFEYNVNSYAGIMTRVFGKVPSVFEQAQIEPFHTLLPKEGLIQQNT